MSNSVPPQQEYLPGVRWGVSWGDSASLSIIWLTVRGWFDWRWHTWRDCTSISSAPHFAPAFSSMCLWTRWERKQEMIVRGWTGNVTSWSRTRIGHTSTTAQHVCMQCFEYKILWQFKCFFARWIIRMKSYDLLFIRSEWILLLHFSDICTFLYDILGMNFPPYKIIFIHESRYILSIKTGQENTINLCI